MHKMADDDPDATVFASGSLDDDDAQSGSTRAVPVLRAVDACSDPQEDEYHDACEVQPQGLGRLERSVRGTCMRTVGSTKSDTSTSLTQPDVVVGSAGSESRQPPAAVPYRLAHPVSLREMLAWKEIEDAEQAALALPPHVAARTLAQRYSPSSVMARVRCAWPMM